MAWIESHQELKDHPKKDRLASLLYGEQALIDFDTAGLAAIGILHCLWWWAMAYAQDGDLSRFSDYQIARGCRWTGDPHVLVQALIEAGFLDGDQQIHDWGDYSGKFIGRRDKDAGRKRSMRDAYANGTIDAVRERDRDTCQYCGRSVNWKDRRGDDGGTYDHVEPAGESTVENLVVACRGCNSRKGGRTPEQAGMPLIKSTQVRPGSRSRTGRTTNLNQPTNQENQEEPSSADEDASLLTLNDEGPQDLFDLFWQPYPRKVGRQEAEEVFRKLSRRDQRAAIQASRNRGKYDKSAGTPKDKIPHPATFLRKARWVDWVKGPPDGYEVTAGGSADPITWAQQTRSCARCGKPITGDQLADAQPVDHGDSIAWYHGPCWETREDAT